MIHTKNILQVKKILLLPQKKLRFHYYLFDITIIAPIRQGVSIKNHKDFQKNSVIKFPSLLAKNSYLGLFNKILQKSKKKHYG